MSIRWRRPCAPMFGNDVGLGDCIGTPKPSAFCRPAVAHRPEDVTTQDGASSSRTTTSSSICVERRGPRGTSRVRSRRRRPFRRDVLRVPCHARALTWVGPEALEGGPSPHLIHPLASHKARNAELLSPTAERIRKVAASIRIAILRFCEPKYLLFLANSWRKRCRSNPRSPPSQAGNLTENQRPNGLVDLKELTRSCGH